MKKIYSTTLFDYRCPLTPLGVVPTWRIVRNYYYRPVWRCEQEHPFDVTTCKDDELYSLRNTSVNKEDEHFQSIVAEINKRQAIHPLLADATKEQIDELYDRTVKNAVKTKLKGVPEPRNYKHLLNDIQLWRNKHGS